MESITESLGGAILQSVPRLDLSPISGKTHGKLKLGPEQLLSVIHAQALALWALTISLRFTRPRLKRGPGGPNPIYADSSILLMAVVQTVCRLCNALHKRYFGKLNIMGSVCDLTGKLSEISGKHFP